MNPFQIFFPMTSQKGFYESFFMRGNHPTDGLAFWIRFTFLRTQQSNFNNAILWFVWFDQKKNKILPFKKVIPIENCKVQQNPFLLHFDNSFLTADESIGEIKNIAWKLRFSTESHPSFLLPKYFYKLPFPKAKSITIHPQTYFDGSICIDGKKINISQWQGSLNHNWGRKHTDAYAWGQVCGFDENENIYFEIISGVIKFGQIESPVSTLAVLRIENQDYYCNQITSWFTQKGKYNQNNWQFHVETSEIEISGEIHSEDQEQIALWYPDTDGTRKVCFNSKIAQCTLEIKIKKERRHFQLKSKNRAAFEILTDHTFDKTIF